ncbi:divalent-cation tolerance protein CutA [Shewanella algae]|uniref:divalent-cation tolerance protein CutA n=1 Tax=Shewanella algae TaxID=38313 RepID=UPI001AAE0955|nr:divalent-cation tolerance protein CutA [Shewanella algae]MBO2617681.1 divalent-cation tolerance protein CutA [Shewanella algae]UZD57923.1 divalent-cation tolerance protein CutA [Shewanella algae]
MDIKSQQALLVFCSYPDTDSAKSLAATLVRESLVACAQVSQTVDSFYAWQGELCQETEVSLQLKCLASAYPRLEQRILELHPYEVPEIIAVPISHGLPAYLDWIKDNTKL